MNQLQRMTWPLHALGLLSLACCDGSSRSLENERYIVIETDCVDWHAHDEDWHRHHCREPIHWCYVPDGGAAFGTAPDCSTAVTAEAGNDASADGATTDATSNTMTSSGGESDGSAVDGGIDGAVPADAANDGSERNGNE